MPRRRNRGLLKKLKEEDGDIFGVAEDRSIKIPVSDFDMNVITPFQEELVKLKKDLAKVKKERTALKKKVKKLEKENEEFREDYERWDILDLRDEL